MQQQLRAAFARWGLPHRLRVDNGKPWGSWSDLPHRGNGVFGIKGNALGFGHVVQHVF